MIKKGYLVTYRLENSKKSVSIAEIILWLQLGYVCYLFAMKCIVVSFIFNAIKIFIRCQIANVL